jgi:DNA-binding response OmpR family regulator
MESLPLRILIIDDDPDSCELMQLMLHYANPVYEVTSVLKPEEGLRLAAARPFDLYLLDCRFVGIHGVEVCRSLRRMDTEKPIMFFTGEAQESVRQEALRAGADAYLLKPDDLKALTGTVKRLLDARKLADRRNLTANVFKGSAVSA